MYDFVRQLDKVYDPKAPEDDMMERYEEMNRMREHVMNEVDKNKDKLISLDEFLESTKNEEFKKDEEWDVSAKIKINLNHSTLGISNFIYFLVLE